MIYENTNQAGFCCAKNFRQYVNEKTQLFSNKTILTEMNSELDQQPTVLIIQNSDHCEYQILNCQAKKVYLVLLYIFLGRRDYTIRRLIRLY